MKDFQEKGIILLCFIYILGGNTANRPWFSLCHTHTPTHRHTHLRSIHTMHGANFPDDKHNLRDALQTSWRQPKRKSIHQHKCVSLCATVCKFNPSIFHQSSSISFIGLKPNKVANLVT